MFRKLRLRLTLINISVMGLLLLLFITGTFFVMQAEISNQSVQVMQMIAQDAGSGQANHFPQHSHRMVQYFYVKTDRAGNITDASSDLPPHPGQVPVLTRKVLQAQRTRGDIDWDEQSFTYLKVPLANGTGYIVVFANVERERDVLGFLLLALLVVGVVSLLLAFYASLFLADRALVPIKKSWQRQQDFVADASHELRTPLAVIQTTLELVMGNQEESVASQRNWLDNMQSETKRMSRLVDNLLFLARSDSAQQVLEVQTFSLTTAFSEAVKPFMALAEAKGVSLQSTADSGVSFAGDENRIKQSIVILLDNALKHTPAGGQICVNLKNSLNEITISVLDTGEGIEQQHLDKIFERFYRVDKARSKNEGGSGLGLSIAKRIVESYRGDIKVSSTPGEGSSFTITLPKPAAQ